MELEKKIIKELSGDIARKHIEKICQEIPFRMDGYLGLIANSS